MDKSLSSKIFVGLFAGLLIGTAIQYLFSGIAVFDTYLLGLAEGVGGMFVSLIKLLVVPLVYVSRLVTSTYSSTVEPDTLAIKRVSLKSSVGNIVLTT